jgi:deoxyribonuclease-4
LAAIIDQVPNHSIGVCLDTQHLWASGIGYRTKAEADKLVRRFNTTVGIDRLTCLHLNDSKVEFGANRDRHANLGEGTIPEAAFRALLGHPKLQGRPAILEIPGFAGDSAAAEDLAVARRWHTEGLALRAAR